MASTIIYSEILYLKENQITLRDEIAGLRNEISSMDKKLDILMDALALVPDSDEMKKRNAETMNMIANIKIEREEILRGE